MTKLFSPLTVGQLRLSNRLCVPPMCQYRAENGLPNTWHTVHYGKMVGSGAGLVVLEATAVSPEGRITPHCLGLWNDEQARAMAELVAQCRSVSPDTKLAVQLSHAGRKASRSVPWEGGAFLPPEKGGFPTISCSTNPETGPEEQPRPMTEEDIQRVIAAFAAAARRAQAAGFDAIQVHAAHGYLIHQFLSPLSNLREDGWGGDLAGRSRFGLAVLSAMREAAPGLALMLRVSATDWVEGGWDLPSTITFARQAKELGCVAIDVSAGGLSQRQRTPELKPGYQVEYARAVKREVGLPTFAVGLISDPLQAEAILAAGDADGVSVGREMLRNPNWGWLAARALNAAVAFPPPYLRAW